MNAAMSSAPSFSGAKPTSFETNGINSSGSWGSLEQAISQAVNPVVPASTTEIKPQVGFGIGESKQTFMVFGPKIEKQIEQVQNVLHQMVAEPASAVERELEQPHAPKGNFIKAEQMIEGTYEQVEKVGKTTIKEGRQVFDAVKDLIFGDIAFKVLTPDQKRQAEERKEKLRIENENKRSFFSSLTNARVAFENMMMKLLNELQDRLGLAGKSVEEKNKLLGVKARNLSFSGVNTPYHIKAIHDALIEQANQQKLAQSKAAAQGPAKKKINYFMDKNSALSRQGQSVYSAAG